MDDWMRAGADEVWEAGFEGDRRVVLSRLGPYRKVFRMPRNYTRRFYHRVFDLAVEDWRIPMAPLDFGGFCRVDVAVQVRFQPTVKYIEQNPACLPDVGAHIRVRYEEMLRDRIEQALQPLEEAGWIRSGHAHVERGVEVAVNETLTLCNIQCRTRCELKPSFAGLEELENTPLLGAFQYQDLHREILRLHCEADERRARASQAQAQAEQRLKLDHEEQLLDLLKRQDELQRARSRQESERMKAEIALAEERLSEQRLSEARRREEQIQHESRLNRMEIDADLKEKAKRFEAISEVDRYLKKEIELLVMEKQRLLLDQDIRNAKLAKAKGWLITGKFFSSVGETVQSLANGRDNAIPPTEGAQSSEEK
jgi:hypothetical protein